MFPVELCSLRWSKTLFHECCQRPNEQGEYDAGFQAYQLKNRFYCYCYWECPLGLLSPSYLRHDDQEWKALFHECGQRTNEQGESDQTLACRRTSLDNRYAGYGKKVQKEKFWGHVGKWYCNGQKRYWNRTKGLEWEWASRLETCSGYGQLRIDSLIGRVGQHLYVVRLSWCKRHKQDIDIWSTKQLPDEVVLMVPYSYRLTYDLRAGTRRPLRKETSTDISYILMTVNNGASTPRRSCPARNQVNENKYGRIVSNISFCYKFDTLPRFN